MPTTTALELFFPLSHLCVWFLIEFPAPDSGKNLLLTSEPTSSPLKNGGGSNEPFGAKGLFSGNIRFRDGNRFFPVLTYLGHMYLPVEVWPEARQESSLEWYFQQKIQCQSGEKIAILPFHLGPSSIAPIARMEVKLDPLPASNTRHPKNVIWNLKRSRSPWKRRFLFGNHHFQVPLANFGGSLSSPKSLKVHPWPPRLLQSYLQHLPEQAHDHLRFGNCGSFRCRWRLHSFLLGFFFAEIFSDSVIQLFWYIYREMRIMRCAAVTCVALQHIYVYMFALWIIQHVPLHSFLRKMSQSSSYSPLFEAYPKKTRTNH